MSAFHWHLGNVDLDLVHTAWQWHNECCPSLFSFTGSDTQRWETCASSVWPAAACAGHRCYLLTSTCIAAWSPLFRTGIHNNIRVIASLWRTSSFSKVRLKNGPLNYTVLADRVLFTWAIKCMELNIALLSLTMTLSPILGYVLCLY
jgi:hypothetical protein